MANNLNEGRSIPFNITAVAFQDGRIFYAVGSTVYYSKVEESPIDRVKCFQINDPTDFDTPDLLASDGGTLTINGIGNILELVSYRDGVLAVSERGAWYITGGPDIATDAFSANRVTEFGIDFPNSLIVVGTEAFYLNMGGLVAIQANEFDVVRGAIVTDSTIKTYLTDTFISSNDDDVEVVFATEVNEVHWFNTSNMNVLVLDIQMRAFYPQLFQNPTGEALVRAVRDEGRNLYDYVSFTNNGDDTGSVKYYELSDDSYLDYGTKGYDAYLETGPESLGNFALKKTVTSIALAFHRTETEITGFNTTTNEFEYDQPSGCLLSQKADLSTYSRYQSRPRQVYMLNRRGWLPDSTTYPAPISDQGDDIVYFEDKIRGHSRVTTFRFEAEHGKDMRLIGFSIDFAMKGRQR